LTNFRPGSEDHPVDKGKPDQSQGRKATGPCFHRDVRSQDPKIAGLPIKAALKPLRKDSRSLHAIRLRQIAGSESLHGRRNIL
jgi:hypothetical protein